MVTGGLRKVMKQPGYVQVPNETVRDRRLSFRARGVLVEILSHVDEWKINATDMTRGDGERLEGREAIETAFKELRAMGYYRLERRRGRDGKFEMGGAVANYSVPEWAAESAEFGNRPVPVQEQPDGSYVVIRNTGSQGSDQRKQGIVAGQTENGFPGPGFPGSGSPGPGKPAPKKKTMQKTMKKPGVPPLASSPPVTGEPETPTTQTKRKGVIGSSVPQKLAEAGITPLRDQGRFLEYLETVKGARDGGDVVMTAEPDDLAAQVMRWRKWKRTATAPDVAPDVEPVMCEHGYDVSAGQWMCSECSKGAAPDVEAASAEAADDETAARKTARAVREALAANPDLAVPGALGARERQSA